MENYLTEAAVRAAYAKPGATVGSACIELGCSDYLLHRCLKEFNIPVHSPHVEKRIALEDLRRCYVDDDAATMKSAAKLLGCSPRLLGRELARFGFQPREKTRNYGKRAKDKRLLDKVWLSEQLKFRTLVDVGAETGVTASCVRAHAIRHDIIRPANYAAVPVDPDAISRILNKAWLASQVAVKPMQQISAELGMPYTKVRNAIVRLGIKLPKRSFRRHSDTRSENVKASIQKAFPDGRSGENHPNWKGGRYKLKSGYVRVYAPDHPHRSPQNTVFEHRLVMEKHLGRYLDPKEVVHHQNGIKDDNRIENLELVATTGEHVSQHFKQSHRVHELEARITELEAQLAGCTCKNKSPSSN